jgi:hypothetical protein
VEIPLPPSEQSQTESLANVLLQGVVGEEQGVVGEDEDGLPSPPPSRGNMA